MGRQAEPDDATLSALLQHLSRDAESLLQQQFALLRAETGESLAQLVTGALLLLAGVLVGLTGALAVVTAVITLLGAVLPLWLACALVGGIVCVSGTGLAIHGKRRLTRATLVPRRALQSLRETGDWLREELT